MNPFKKDKKQLSVFITAGFPKLMSTTEQILKLQNQGVDFIEVGIPFSDPMADGPVIQESSAIALKNGMNMDILFDQLISIRDEVKIPLVLMGYLNPVLQYGLQEFLTKCKMSGIKSVILPDMSVEIYERYYKDTFEEFSMPVTFLITPDSEKERIEKIGGLSEKSFIYLVSSTKITGQVFSPTKELQEKYLQIRKICTNIPIMMGFGISSKSDVQLAQKYCDGAIIGSAYIKSIMEKEELEILMVCEKM